MSDGLNSLLFTEDAFVTQNFPSAGIYLSHGSAFILSKSSSNVTALIFPAFRRTRSAVRRNIFARLTASSSPQNVTLPSSTWTISYPRSVISFFKTASRPKWHGATNSILLICRPFQYPAIRASSHVYLIRSRR